MKCASLFSRRLYIGTYISVDVYTDYVPILDALEMRSENSRGTSAKHALELWLLTCSDPPGIWLEIPAGAGETVRGDGVVICGGEHAEWGYWLGKARSCIQPRRKRGFVTIPGYRHLNPEAVLRMVTRPVLDRLIGCTGAVSLHAAAAAIEGKGIAILGSAGSGKSTCLYRLLGKGADCYGDDRAVILPSGKGSPVLAAYPDYLRLTDTTYAPKKKIVPLAVDPREVPLNLLVFLDRGKESGPTTVRRLGAAETAARLLQHCMPGYSAEPAMARMHKAALLAGRVSSCVIGGDGGVDETVENVMRYVADAVV